MSPPSQLEVPPSAVFIYSPRSIDDLKAPLSPTSSLKGVFVRSRPTSTDFSDYEYNEFPGIGTIARPGSPSPLSTDEESDASTPSTDDILAATDRWAHAHAHTHDNPRPADARSIALSTYTTTSRMRIVRRSDANMHEEEIKLARENHELQVNASKQGSGDSTEAKAEKEKEQEKTKTHRSTWRSYKAIRKTVSSILHRKDSISLSVPRPAATGKAGGTPTTASPAAADADADAHPMVIIDAPIECIKPSSTSLFSRRRNLRRRATTDADHAEPNVKPKAKRPATTTADALEYRAQLRRSRSFSGFTNVLSAIDDEEPEQEDLDEATAEARQLVVEIRRRWAFEDVPDDDRDGYLFERAVEQRMW